MNEWWDRSVLVTYLLQRKPVTGQKWGQGSKCVGKTRRTTIHKQTLTYCKYRFMTDGISETHHCMNESPWLHQRLSTGRDRPGEDEKWVHESLLLCWSGTGYFCSLRYVKSHYSSQLSLTPTTGSNMFMNLLCQAVWQHEVYYNVLTGSDLPCCLLLHMCTSGQLHTIPHDILRDITWCPLTIEWIQMFFFTVAQAVSPQIPGCCFENNYKSMKWL